MSNLEKTLAKLESIISSGNLSFDYGFDLRNKNYATGRNYQGIFNNLVLSTERYLNNYKYPYWIGFHQAIKMYIPIKKEQKGTPIMCLQYKKKYLDILGNEVEEDDNRVALTEQSRFWNTVYVWNIEQTSADLDSINSFSYSENTNELEKMLDKYISREKIALNHDAIDYCNYSLVNDTISMIHKDRFYDQTAYFEALTHECSHSTGHQSRLNRDIQTKDREKYNNEEIIAEFATMMIMSEFDIEKRNKDMATYIASYLNGNSIKSVYGLCLQSQNAVDYIHEKYKKELT